MWKKTDVKTSHPGQTFKIKEKNKFISHRRFLNLLAKNDEFINCYNQLLANCPFNAFFWENSPVTEQNIDDPYECTLVESSHLYRVSADPDTFENYFDGNSDVVQFPNLGGDAQLVVPCPIADDSVYTQIGSFVRGAPEHQIFKFWNQTGNAMLNQIQSDPRWLSTSGLGVYWLHVRIDSVPKYYQTESYKQTV